MWTDMQKELGNAPGIVDRGMYKYDWCDKYGFGDIKNCCFLCEYSRSKSPQLCCHCPVKWPTWAGTCFSSFLEDGTQLKSNYYLVAPISEILALPEREDV